MRLFSSYEILERVEFVQPKVEMNWSALKSSRVGQANIQSSQGESMLSKTWSTHI